MSRSGCNTAAADGPPDSVAAPPHSPAGSAPAPPSSPYRSVQSLAKLFANRSLHNTRDVIPAKAGIHVRDPPLDGFRPSPKGHRESGQWQRGKSPLAFPHPLRSTPSMRPRPLFILPLLLLATPALAARTATISGTPTAHASPDAA